MDPFVDRFLTVFHSALVLFILLGWIPPRLRRWHLAVVLLTAVSWFLLGLRYGMGYCVLTDWHWAVKERLGQTGLPLSFIEYLLEGVTGRDLDAGLVADVSLGVFLFILGLSLILNLWSAISARRRSIR